MSDETKQAVKWYWGKAFVLFVLMSAGPLGLPIVWYNPHMDSRQKWIWSVVTVVLTVVLVQLSVSVFQKTMQQYKELGLLS